MKNMLKILLLFLNNISLSYEESNWNITRPCLYTL